MNLKEESKLGRIYDIYLRFHKILMLDSNNNSVGETQFSSQLLVSKPSLPPQSPFKMLPAALVLLTKSQEVGNGLGMLSPCLGKLLPFPDGS